MAKAPTEERTWGRSAGNVWRSLSLVWSAQPRYATALIALVAAQGFLPVASLWTGRLLIDTIITATGTESPAALI